MSSPPRPPLPRGVANARKIAELRFQKLFEDADAMSIQGYLADGTVPRKPFMATAPLKPWAAICST
jgi:hypothetical protein